MKSHIYLTKNNFFHRNKKGIIFAIDGLISLVILLLLLYFPFAIMSANNNYYDSTIALSLAKDVSLVLIESDILKEDLIAYNFSTTMSYLNASIPPQFGSYIKVVQENGTIFNISGTSCKLYSKHSYKQPIYANGFYIFEVILC